MTSFILPQRPASPFQKRFDDLRNAILKARMLQEDQIIREAIIRYCGGMPCLVFCGYMGHRMFHPDGSVHFSWGRRDNVIAVVPPLFVRSGGGR